MLKIPRTLILALLLAVLIGPPRRQLAAPPNALVQEAEEEMPATINLDVTPTDEPVPALKYRLLPGPFELEYGNARGTETVEFVERVTGFYNLMVATQI